MTAPEVTALKITEAELQAMVIESATLYGWRVHHSRPARAKDGSWSTPIEGHKGLPDLVLARDGVVLLAELKSDRGTTSDDQTLWLEAAGEHGRVWRPAQWFDGSIVNELRRQR